MPKTGPLGLAGTLLMALSLVFLFFIVLSGTADIPPFSRTYFLRANTGGIDGAKDWSQWTFLYICRDANRDCGSATPALPLGQAWNDDSNNVPEGLAGSVSGTSKKFFLLSRFSWVFILLTLFTTFMALVSGCIACVGCLGYATPFLICNIASICHSLASILTTITYTLARDAFVANGRHASLGKSAFGFLWGSYAALLNAVIMFGVAMCKGRSRDRKNTFLLQNEKHCL